MQKQLSGMLLLKNIMKITNFFKITNFNFEEINKQVNVKIFAEEFNDFVTVPDEFNKFYIKYGWVAYGSLNFELMKNCVELAKINKFSDAENTLLNHFSNEHIGQELMLLPYKLDVIKKRMDILNQAFNDYREGKYYTCIPLILMMIDGIVCDVNPQQKSGEGATIEAWDSISGHPTGLQKLYKEIMHKNRRKTTAEEIYLPYRNGILHGRDLGYANKTVAVKSWNILFAVCDWAKDLKSEKSRKQKYDKQQKLYSKPLTETLDEYLKTKDKNDKIKEKMNAWKPRKFAKKYFPLNINEAKFEEKSPEQVLLNLLDYWQKQQYGKIAGCLYKVEPEQIKAKAGEIRKELNDKIYIDSQIIKIVDEAPAITEITINLKCKINEEIKIIKNVKIRLICQDPKDEPTTRNNDIDEIRWVFIPAFLYNIY